METVQSHHAEFQCNMARATRHWWLMECVEKGTIRYVHN